MAQHKITQKTGFLIAAFIAGLGAKEKGVALLARMYLIPDS